MVLKLRKYLKYLQYRTSLSQRSDENIALLTFKTKIIRRILYKNSTGRKRIVNLLNYIIVALQQINNLLDS